MSQVANKQILEPGALEELIKMALDEAKSQGVDQAEAAASHDAGLSVTARFGDVENLEYTNDRGVWVFVRPSQRPVHLPILRRRIPILVWRTPT